MYFEGRLEIIFLKNYQKRTKKNSKRKKSMKAWLHGSEIM